MAPWPSERLRILYSVEKITCPTDWSKGWESPQGKAQFWHLRNPTSSTPDLNPHSSEGPPPGSPVMGVAARPLSPPVLQSTPSVQASLQRGLGEGHSRKRSGKQWRISGGHGDWRPLSFSGVGPTSCQGAGQS